jgi:hypothetical protein
LWVVLWRVFDFWMFFLPWRFCCSSYVVLWMVFCSQKKLLLHNCM